jgi:UDP-GlcNAc:undecaprenyl-phosphate GlcNAc-1-phosphate transferase
MPKTGGIAMALGALIPILFWAPSGRFITAALISAGIVVLIGIIDDIWILGYKAKFAGQLTAALIFILYGGIKIKSLGMLLPATVVLPDWLSIPITLVFLVAVTNSINLSDGLDGLAGGISLLIFACIGYLAFQGGNILIAMFSAAMAGAIIGFLRFNTYPAVLFMGDTGSQLLGFMAGTLSISLTQGNTLLNPSACHLYTSGIFDFLRLHFQVRFGMVIFGFLRDLFKCYPFWILPLRQDRLEVEKIRSFRQVC